MLFGQENEPFKHNPIFFNNVCQPASPTAINLVSFEIEANHNQAVVTWETGTEIDNAGFTLYRGFTSKGPWHKANSILIAAQGGSVSGTHYTFTDIPGRGVFYYAVEDIDFFGVSSVHEPVLIDMGLHIACHGTGHYCHWGLTSKPGTPSQTSVKHLTDYSLRPIH